MPFLEKPLDISRHPGRFSRQSHAAIIFYNNIQKVQYEFYLFLLQLSKPDTC